MGFLDNIKRWLSKKKQSSSFAETVKKEKKRTYLFDTKEDTYVSPRSQKRGIFGKIKPKKKHSEKFSNFFQDRFDKMSKDRDIRYIVGAIGVLLLLLSTYIIVFSPYFKISPNRVLIEPVVQWIDLSIAYRSIEDIYGKSIFLLDEKSIALKIKESLQNTENIRIDRLFPNGVKILIKSLPMPFDTTIAGIENKRFWLSSNGVLVPISDIKDTVFDRHIEVVAPDLRSEMFLGYKKILSDRTMFLISKTFEVFEHEWKDLTIARWRFFPLENELHLILESNTKIILAFHDENNTPSGHVPNILIDEFLTLKTYITNHRNRMTDGSIAYIDARIPGKLFICSDHAQCQQNLILVYGSIYK